MSKRLLTLLAFGTMPFVCLASDTYSSSQWALLAFCVSFAFILPVYAISLVVFGLLARNGSNTPGLLAHAIPFVVVGFGILLAGTDLLGIPLFGAWLVAWVLYKLLLKRFGSRGEA